MMLNEANHHDFFLLATRRLAQCLAALKPTPEEKFNKLWRLCPQETGDGIFILDSRARDVVLALGMYYSESGYQYSERIVPYLLKFFCGLRKDNCKISDIERFMFAIHTLLSDVAAYTYWSSNIRVVVISNQVKMLEDLAMMGAMPFPFHYETLLGLIRAMGRCSSKEALFTKAISSEDVEDYSPTRHICVRGSTISDSESNGSLHKFRSAENTFDLQVPDEKEPPPDTDFIFCGLLKEIIAVLKAASLLQKMLDKQNSSYADRLRLEIVALLKRLLCDQIKSSEECILMIRDIADTVYNRNVISLSSFYSKAHVETASRTCGDCLVLLEWTATEQSEADRLFDMLQTLVEGQFTEKEISVLAPVFISAFQCVTNIALKFRELLEKCISLLRNFLVSPVHTVSTFINNPILENIIITAAFSLSRAMQQKPDCSNQLVMYMSNKSISDTLAVSENAIVTLGTLAVKLAPSSVTVQIIQILQQHFYHSETFLNPLILRKLGDIAVARVNFATYKQILTFIFELSGPVPWPQVLEVLTRLARSVDGFSLRQDLLLRLLALFIKLALRDASPHRAIELISVIDILVRRIPRVSVPDERLRQLFFDFWLCCVVFGLPNDDKLRNIAIKSPTLFSEQILQNDPILKNDAFVESIPLRYRNQIFRHSAFLMAVQFLAELRVEEANGKVASFLMYTYLEANAVRKSGMLPHMFRITESVLSKIITILTTSGRHEELEKYALALLVKSASPVMDIRQESCRYLETVSKAFPPILWRREVIWRMLEILQIFYGSSSSDGDKALRNRDLRTWLQLEIYNIKSRKEAVTDFEKMCSRFLQEGMNHVPHTIQSHLQEYVAVRPEHIDILKSHEGIGLILDLIFKPDKALTLRCRHTGEVAGVIKQGHEALTKLKKELLASNDAHSLFQLTAVIIALPRPGRKLMHKLCTSPMSEARSEAMACWNWLMSARPDLEERFLCHMSSAFQETFLKGLGLFSGCFRDSTEQHNDFEMTLPQKCNDLGLHKGWVCFLTERIRCSYPKHLEIFADLLQQSLPVRVEVRSRLCRHVDVSGTRFALLNSALTIFANNSSVNETGLRERIYASALDYFAGPPTCPSKMKNSLQTNIDTMMAFWNDLYKDKTLMKRSLSINSKLGNNGKSSRTIQRYIKVSNLILSLLAVEIDFLITWNNPHSSEYLKREGEEIIFHWRSFGFNPLEGHQLMNLAWAFCPALAVYLPSRFKNSEVLRISLPSLVRNEPMAVCDIPEALEYFTTPEAIMDDDKCLTYILTWCHISPFHALSFFSRQLPVHPLTCQYAVRVLSVLKNDILAFCTPQIVQALRHDGLGYVREFILKISSKSQLVAHQLIWNLRSTGSPVGMKPIFDRMIIDIVEGFSDSARVFYEGEFRCFDDITSIARVLRKFPKAGDERLLACKSNLQALRFRKGCYLPYNPELIILELDHESAKPLQSAAKAPFQALFKVQHCPTAEIELFAPYHTPSGPMSWQMVIFKEGDDIRQDCLALQLIDIFHNVFRRENLDLYLRPYRVVATSSGCGIVECVPHTKSRDQLGRETGRDLYGYFKSVYGPEDSPKFVQARENFCQSLAAYSVVTYLLQVKDRHNGNILVDTDGHVIHIDFGFLFESSPGGNLGFEPDLKITDEMMRILGVRSFLQFMGLCVKAYLAIRPYREDVITLVTLMLDTHFPCFRGQTIEQLRERFQPVASDREAAQHMLGIIRSSCHNVRTWAYDAIQYYQNQISF